MKNDNLMYKLKSMITPDFSLELPCSLEEVDDFLSIPQTRTLETLRLLRGDILVLGAGGKMGLHLSKMLKEAMCRLGKSNIVWAASRFKTLNSMQAYEASGIRTLAGDFLDSNFVDQLPDCPVVFYLVGAKFRTSGKPDLLRAINVELPKTIAERFCSSRIVAFSTGCVYSYTTVNSGGSTEESETNPIGDYALSCLGREEAFIDGSKKFGTKAVLIRLNYSVEFRYGIPVDIALKILNDEPVDVSNGHVNLIWQNDAINQIIQCLTLVDSPAVPINITGPEIVSVREIANYFGRLFKKDSVFIGQEQEKAWLSDASRSHVLFGKPVTDLVTMLNWIAAWLLGSRRTFNKPTGFERRDGKF